MIAHLEGVLREKGPTRAVIDVGGVGYEVLTSLSTFSALPDEGKTVALRIHTHVRDDVLQLFGFHTHLERTLFEALIRVNGVGPKLAQAVLSGVEPRQLLTALRDGDLATLRGVPGVGQKSAQRILIDLRDRAIELDDDEGLSAPTAKRHGEDRVEAVISAMVNLGTQRARAERAAEEALREADDDAEIEVLIRSALQRLAR